MSSRKRWRYVALGGVVGALLVAAGCSFPDVGFSSDDFGEAGANSEGGTADASGDAVVVVDATDEVNPDVDPEGGAKEAGSAGDAALVIDAAGCVTCDCDGDGYERIDLAAGCDGGGKGLPADCDDTVKAINPGALDFSIDPWPIGAKHTLVGDWDCSGGVTKQFPYNGECGALKTCSSGFAGDPECGTSTDYLTCQTLLVPLLGLTCSTKTDEPPGKRRQACH